ncbi:deoxynucleoside kinase [Tetragenococcus koreensis]|uniref:deoxynucleoside kinase n=1 Tax=Tetragenococcus koreensis TaxID=290335 RepID=UPI000F4F6A40|nr:deoxynucleoside kinase [Tetragenococcus koreensis]AYW45686.1 deoxynucleoside kinase [Tetragenococcus koreensis]MCF1619889.1 deoxynucleoside kinase [Tetragenococcus koreensis]MCF1657374.1 deoxynucleoside kinase [Tetragenococcus koreensis]GEN90696.1 deoxynucleoside kinase [Tetragenococcus koreensis]
MIYIMGTIAAGKTSLAKILAEDLQSPVYYEDVENNGLILNMLEKFYSSGRKSRKSNGAILQIAFLTFRYQQLRQAITQQNAVMDSSLESDFVMASQLHDHGEIDEEDFNVYVTLSQEMQANVNGIPWNGLPDLVIYLKIDADHAINEIQKRGREMENTTREPGLTDYYQRVHHAYENWANGYHPAILLTIDRERYDYVKNAEDRNDVLDLIETKLKDLGKLSPKTLEKIKQKRK